MLRDYQQAALDAAISHIKKSIEPAVIEAATGAGKSHIIAALANWLNKTTKKKVLVLQPSKELVEQNHEKYLKTGNPASVFCAAIKKELKHPVTFGTPLSVKNNIKSFGEISLLIIDECDGITKTLKSIVNNLRDRNKNLRIIGLTATPYRMNTGYIYQYEIDGSMVPDTQTIEPYFHRLIFRVTARELIDRGFLTPPTTDATYSDSYNASGLQLNKRGRFDSSDIEKTFVGKGRKTSKIIEDIVYKSRGKMGVMLFAASKSHAIEIMESLPDCARLVTGDTLKKEREKTISDFKKQKFKYIVSIGTLTTGFDAPHCDVIAILRPTESARLLQQIIGRVLRLHDDKIEGLVLDYAQNFERHFPDGDIFNPDIKARPLTEGAEIKASCVLCGFENVFSARRNEDGFEVDEEGYFVDLLGNRIIVDGGQPLPAHYGRRCMGFTLDRGLAKQCNQRWSFKTCPECGQENDIAARRCVSCKAELVDPNEKLRLEYAKLKKDPYSPTEDKIISWKLNLHKSNKGNDTVKVVWSTECRKMTVYYQPKNRRIWDDFCNAVFGEPVKTVRDFFDKSKDAVMPATIIAAKNRNTGYFNVYGHKAATTETN